MYPISYVGMYPISYIFVHVNVSTSFVATPGTLGFY